MAAAVAVDAAEGVAEEADGVAAGADGWWR
jgi:hypothetical protein